MRRFLPAKKGGLVDYDAIVIGSGFGGTIAATRLALKGKKTLILERGTWWITPEQLGKPPPLAPGKQRMPDWLKEQKQPVQYWPRPDHKEGLLDVFASVRTHLNRDGLYQFSIFKDATVVTASAVGGGSMIYTNVTIRPDAEVLDQIGLDLGDAEYQAAYDWMADYRGPLNHIVTKIPLPGRDVTKLTDDDYLYLDRARVLRDAAAEVAPKLGLELPWAPLDLSVFEYDPNRGDKSAAAKNHTFCERQGRCLLGCLPAARQTLNKALFARLLSDPNAGVALSPLSEVQHLKRQNGGWAITYHDHRSGDEHTVSAPMVFLAAGTLGSTQLLLRSQREGLALSDRLGHKFSTNGDFGGFVVDTAKPVQSARGPVNTCHVKATIDGTRITVEDCAIPAMFASIASAGLHVLDSVIKRRLFHTKLRFAWVTHTVPDLRDFLPHLPDTYDPKDARTEAETVANIFFFNAMGQDDASGVFSLDDDGELDLKWDKPIVKHPTFTKTNDLCQELSKAMGGDYVALWDALPRKRLTIPHPLGGCPVGATRDEGVVDAHGAVFDGAGAAPTDTHPGLFVVDGSTIPGALAVNPTLTIAAQALKSLASALP